MKQRLYLILLLVAVTLSGLAQNIGEAFYIYRNDGQFNAFFRDEVISIDYSYEDADGNTYDEIVTQIVNTADSVYKIPLAAIDSIGFVQPETKYKQGTVLLTGNLYDYLIASDNFNLTFSLSMPSALLPNVGDKLVSTDLSDKLPLGFTGTVKQVAQTTSGYLVSCDSLALEEAVDRFYGVAEIVGQEENSSARRHLKRRAFSEKANTFRLVIPPIFNQKFDLSLFVKPKKVYEISGKAVVTTSISPVMTGRISRVVDNVLNIDHYNVHAVTDVTTKTTVEVVGEVSNKDNPFNKSNPQKSFTIEDTKPGPWGIPIYYAFGPNFDLSGEIALGTTVYVNFTNTTDITYYPLTTAVGIVAPGLSLVANQFNNMNGSTKMTRFDIDWQYIAGNVSASVSVCGRLGIGFKNLGWVGFEAQVGAKAEAKLGFDLEALSKAEKGTGFYDGLKDNAKVTVMPYWGLESKVSVLDDRYNFTFIGRDDYSFWGKKWEWDFLPKFSNTKAMVINGSSIEVSADITNDCIIPYTVGFSLFDENDNKIGEPQWDKQKFWTRNSFGFPFKTTFSDLATDKKYKAYPTLRLFGFNVLASPSSDIDIQFPVKITSFEQLSSRYKEDGYVYNNGTYHYRYNDAITAELSDSEGIVDWGYVFEGPDGVEMHISLRSHGVSTVTDTKCICYSDKTNDEVTICGYVKYGDDSQYYYGEKETYQLTYEGEGLPVKITDFQQTASDYSKQGFNYEGRNYSYKYDCSVTIELMDSKEIIDWGYVYEDQYGNENMISLMGFTSPYKDERYSYYRDEAEATVRLYEYVKYENDDFYYYGDSHDYPVTYEDQIAVVTLSANVKDTNAAIISGRVNNYVAGIDDGEVGFFYNTIGNPVQGNAEYVSAGMLSQHFGGEFEVELAGLESAKTYYYCAYLYIDGEYRFGETQSFETKKGESVCPDSHHPHWIDLGLPSGTKWRCCNEGASTPEGFGGYYTFGQVSSAPSLDQIKELIDNTSYVWTTQNGVNGGKFTGRNGGTIFLPAAGLQLGGGLNGVGSWGDYWSSSRYGEYNAYELYLNSFYTQWGTSYGRSSGQSVRPVR